MTCLRRRLTSPPPAPRPGPLRPPPLQCFWPTTPHFLRPTTGAYTFANYHVLGTTNVLSAWVRPHVSGRRAAEAGGSPKRAAAAGGQGQ